MNDPEQQRRKELRKVRQLKLPIVTFDDQLDAELRSRGVQTTQDSDGQLAERQEEHELTLFDYMVSSGLIIMED